MGLSGSNVWVAVADSWIPTNGVSQFNDDLTNIVGDMAFFPVGIADTVGHATHVGGIIAGSGLHSPTNAVGSQFGADFRGKAPHSIIWAEPALTPLVTDSVLQESSARTNALISNNSWGYGTSDYNLAAASYDQAVRDSLPGATGSQPVIYVFAAGNDGQGDDSGQGGIPDTILSPAVAKNVISVGASELPRGITNDVYVCDSCNTNNTGCTTNKPWAGMTDSQNQVARFSSRGNVGIGIEGDFGRFKPDVIAPGTFVVSTRSKTWDEAAYYNPITDDTTAFFNETVRTNMQTFYSVFVPCDALQLTIEADAVHPAPMDLPIYGKGTDFPNPPADLLGSNLVTGTTSGGPDFTLSPVDTFWYYAVGNPTNETVTYNVFTDVLRTNELGTYWDVLRTNLNDQLFSTNKATTEHLYRYESGTSMAAPAVSGTLALMEDYFTNQWKYTPSPALMKALLINGARAFLDSPYDFQVQNGINYQGWGLINLTNSLPYGITNKYDTAAPMIILDQDSTNALATGDSRTLMVQVNSNAQSAPMRITLVWTDPPGNPAASIKLVNDLDLVVTNMDDPTNPVVFVGNNFQPGSLYTAPWNGDTNNIPSADNVNNVENVYIPARWARTIPSRWWRGT
jgi:subtilisin family serine protease